jgi:hypothetical protein
MRCRVAANYTPPRLPQTLSPSKNPLNTATGGRFDQWMKEAIPVVERKISDPR